MTHDLPLTVRRTTSIVVLSLALSFPTALGTPALAAGTGPSSVTGAVAVGPATVGPRGPRRFGKPLIVSRRAGWPSTDATGSTKTGTGTGTGAASPLPQVSAVRGPQAVVPEGDVVVPVGGLRQALLDSSPLGTRFVLQPGVHRLPTALTPRPGQQLLGHEGSVLSGAKELTGWIRSGDAWYVDGQTQRLPANDVGVNPCESGTLCQDGSDVFLDDHPVRQVATRGEVGPGTFFFDKTASRIWLGTDPAGRKVETTVTAQALVHMRDVVLRNLVVEKFGNPVQTAAVHGTGLTIENCLVRLNHGTGVLAYGGVLRRNVIDRNGQLGLGGGGTGQLVEDNEIVGNNTMGYDADWEAGGTKFAFSSGLVVRGNWVHRNDGQGLWTDIDNIHTTYESNVVEDNTGIGIFHEISFDAVIRDNTVRRNGTRAAYFNSRVGINVTNSSRVQVTGNTVTDNAGGQLLAVQDPRTGSGQLGPRELRSVTFSNNTASGPGSNGVWIYDTVADRSSYFTTRGITFHSNTYRLPDLAGRHFTGGDAALHEQSAKTWAQWRATGQDAGSAAV